MRRRLLILLLAGLACPAGARAATSVSVGASSYSSGPEPVVVVSPDGAAHVAYQRDHDTVNYCRIPAGGSTCTDIRSLDTTTDIGALQIFLNGTAVEIWVGDTCQTYSGVERFSFTDGGGAASHVCTTASTGGTQMTSGEGFLTSGQTTSTANDILLSAGGGAGGYEFHAVTPGAGSDGAADVNVFASSAVAPHAESVAEGTNGGGTDLVVSHISANPQRAEVAVYKPTAANALASALNTDANWAKSIPIPGSDDVDDSASTHVLPTHNPAVLFVDSPTSQKPLIKLAFVKRVPAPGVLGGRHHPDRGRRRRHPRSRGRVRRRGHRDHLGQRRPAALRPLRRERRADRGAHHAAGDDHRRDERRGCRRRHRRLRCRLGGLLAGPGQRLARRGAGGAAGGDRRCDRPFRDADADTDDGPDHHRQTDRKAPFRQTLTVDTDAARGGSVTLRARASIKVRHHRRRRRKSITAKLKVCR